MPAERQALSKVLAAEAGKHLPVEKPLATTVEDAKAIVAALHSDVRLMVGSHNRVNPPMIGARDTIRRCEIGSPAYVDARLSNSAIPAYFPPAHYEYAINLSNSHDTTGLSAAV